MIGRIKILLERLQIHDIDLQSDFVELPLRHHRYELNKTTPFTWFIDSDDKSKTIKVKIIVDKEAFADDKDVDSIVLDTLKHNEAFKDFVDSLQSFEPNNKSINNLYNLETWDKSDKKHTVSYTETIKFGV